MNKTKKIATAVVATVMAGTMVASFTACNPDGPSGPGNQIGSGKDLYGIINENGDINYDVYKTRGENGEVTDKVTLNIAVGHNNRHTSTSFQTLGDTITLPDGNEYGDGDLKPAWRQMGDDLNITFKDVYYGDSTANNLGNLISNNNDQGHRRIDDTDMFTSDLSKVVSQVNSTSTSVSILNLAEYLDYMPHFKAFLEQNPVVYLSLLQDGMDEETGEGQELYVAPYFDGYNDIERYCLIRQDWAEKLLNGTEDLAQNGVALGTATAAVSYMGSTGSYSIESLNETGTGKITITKDYTKVLEEIKKDGTALKAAYDAIVPAGYTGNSGNIVDIQNEAIKANPNANGKQLVNLFRAYIDVCYGGHYTADKRANLFNGYDAAWDVDDLTAMLRCVKTNAANLGVTNIGGIAPRSSERDRVNDLLKLAGQLYGVRGTASTLEFTYIDAQGKLHDARTDKEFYECMEKMNKLTQEGLVANYGGTYSGKGGVVTIGTDTYECFMMYDYSQTQTVNDFYTEDATISGRPDVLAGKNDFNFAAIMTPVSKWDVDGNAENGHEVTMRFTESWRSVKTSGLAVNGNVAQNKAKLDAVLQFIDYLYSEDGQIVSTFGPQAENADSKGGFWYDEPLANQNETDSTKYFKYKGTKYSGYMYKGQATPTATDKVQQSFRDKEVEGFKVTSNSNTAAGKLSYTDYARRLMGATLPVGVKNQSLENQMTAVKGEAGASKVSVALSEQFQTVKGMTLEVNEDNYWYTCVPTGLPVASNDQSILDADAQTNFLIMSGVHEKKDYLTIEGTIILRGTNTTYSGKTVPEFTFTSIDDLLAHKFDTEGQSILELATARQRVHNRAWETALAYWDYLKDNINK